MDQRHNPRRVFEETQKGKIFWHKDKTCYRSVEIYRATWKDSFLEIIKDPHHDEISLAIAKKLDDGTICSLFYGSVRYRANLEMLWAYLRDQRRDLQEKTELDFFKIITGVPNLTNEFVQDQTDEIKQLMVLKGLEEKTANGSIVWEHKYSKQELYNVLNCGPIKTTFEGINVKLCGFLSQRGFFREKVIVRGYFVFLEYKKLEMKLCLDENPLSNGLLKAIEEHVYPSPKKKPQQKVS